MKLGDHFLAGKFFFEHHAAYYPKDIIELSKEDGLPGPICFKNKKDCYCFGISANGAVISSYYIGIDWFIENRKAVYVQSKINKDSEKQVDYLAMLFEALKHPDVFEHTSDLFEIKWDKPEIKINYQQDMLTPLLVLQFLQVVKSIVRKGLKKSYYKVEHNLRSRVKGKILVAQNIKQNLAKSKTLNTICAYEEFGYNGIENRILKKALVFVQRYLPSYALHQGNGSADFFTPLFNYIMPAFEQVSEEANIRDCQHLKINPFYKEYKLAIDLAKQILRRFGYNINKTSTHQVSTPPFWIDMSKLFELYVLGLLKDSYKNVGTLHYHVKTSGNELDFLLDAGDFKMVIDAKYKIKYQKGLKHSDVRQVSGYARLKTVYKRLSIPQNKIIKCLIIYPDKECLQKNEKQYINLEKKAPIKGYVGIYKYGVKLPIVS